MIVAKIKSKKKDKSVQYYLDVEKKYKQIKKELAAAEDYNMSLESYNEALVQHNKSLESVIVAQDKLIKFHQK